MYFAELSRLTGFYEQSPECVAVGWLDSEHEFATGPTSPEFRKKLRTLCARPVRLTRGFHVCEFCVGNVTRGNGEIHVQGPAGDIFVAPAMISHYVDTHNYQPPDSFVVAVESKPEFDAS